MVSYILDAGYVVVEGDHVTLKEAGRQLRVEIEEETDRVYFAPWPLLSEDELDSVYTSLESVCAVLRA